MKVINSSPITSFGGLNFVLEKISQLGIDNLFEGSLPKLPAQSKYKWKNILYSYWSILFCGGDCAPHTLQDETIERMFLVLGSQGIKVDVFRADSASYQFPVITM